MRRCYEQQGAEYGPLDICQIAVSHPECATAFTCDEVSEVRRERDSTEGSYLLPNMT